MTRSLVPTQGFYYPCLYPPEDDGYYVDIYEQLLDQDMMVYEVRKPNEVVPYTFVFYKFKDHLDFFYALWNLDEFETSSNDRHFLHRLWYHLCRHHGSYRPDHFSIPIGEDDEPAVFRYNARYMVLHYLEEAEKENLGIKELVGR